MNSDWNKSAIIAEQEKAFRLPKQPPSWQDKKRTLVCLLEMRPLETVEQFAQRVWQALQEHEAKQPTKKPMNRSARVQLQSATSHHDHRPEKESQEPA